MTRILRYSLYSVVVLAFFIALFYLSHSKKEPEFSSFIYKTKSGWAYNIQFNHKVIIQQEFIPAVQGSHPFESESDARHTSELVIHKLMKRQLPSISMQELDSLHVKY